jgi:hypothetical protein
VRGAGTRPEKRRGESMNSALPERGTAVTRMSQSNQNLTPAEWRSSARHGPLRLSTRRDSKRRAGMYGSRLVSTQALSLFDGVAA